MPSSPDYVRDPAEFNGYLIHPDGRVWRPEMVRVRRDGIRKYNGCTAETAARIWEERNVKKRKLTDIASEFGLSYQSVSRIARGGHHAIIA